MEKRIVGLSTNPHTIALVDRSTSLFIDPKTESILVDEGDGEGRMNGAVFSAENGLAFVVTPLPNGFQRLSLDYCGTRYFIGGANHSDELVYWVKQANAFIAEKIATPCLVAETNTQKNIRD